MRVRLVCLSRFGTRNNSVRLCEENYDDAYLNNSITGRLHVLGRLFTERAGFSGNEELGSAKLA